MLAVLITSAVMVHAAEAGVNSGYGLATTLDAGFCARLAFENPADGDPIIIRQDVKPQAEPHLAHTAAAAAIWIGPHLP